MQTRTRAQLRIAVLAAAGGLLLFTGAPVHAMPPASGLDGAERRAAERLLDRAHDRGVGELPASPFLRQTMCGRSGAVLRNRLVRHRRAVATLRRALRRGSGVAAARRAQRVAAVRLVAARRAQARACAPAAARSTSDSQLGTLDGTVTTQRPAAVLRGRGMVIALPVDFRDVPARRSEHAPARYEQMLFDDAYPHGGGSLATYWRDMSFGTFTVDGDVAAWRRMPGRRAEYAGGSGGMGARPANSQSLLEHAVAAHDATVDFARYDNDGPDGRPNSGDDDGVVDAVFLVFAGTTAAESGDLTSLWPHAWRHQVATRDRSANGGMIRVDRYAALPERMHEPGPDGDLLTVGIAAHEYGHVLGLPDLVDGESHPGPGAWDLMAGGMYGFEHSSRPSGLSAWSRARLGWLTPQLLEGDHVGHALGSSYARRTAVKLPIADTPLHEHFLVERRTKTGFDADLPGEGLLVWHVDDSLPVEGGTEHARVELVAADGRADANAGDLLGGGQHLGDASTPSTHAHDGGDSKVVIQNVEATTVDLHAGAASLAPVIDRSVEAAGPQAAFPLSSITSPTDGARVRGTVTLTCDASGSPNISRVQFQVDGANVDTQTFAQAPAATRTFAWDTTAETDGTHTLGCRARNTSNQWTNPVPTITVTVDNTAPGAPSVTAPTAGSWVRGTASFGATGTDNYGVTRYSFRVDGTDDWRGPWTEATPQVQSIAWDTTLVANGPHTLSLRSEDLAGNQSVVSAGVAVNVDNTLPTLGVPRDGSVAPDIDTQASAVVLNANWDAGTDTFSGMASYAWRFCTTPACASVVASGSGAGLVASATGLSLADGTYHACVRPVDVAGNQGAEQCSDGVQVDATAPTMSTPLDGATPPDLDAQVSTTTLDANWTAAGDGGGTGVASYDWRFCDSPACGTVLASGSGVALTASATGLSLTTGGTYHACVRATDQLGNASAWSCSDGIVTGDPPPTMSTPTDGTALPDRDAQTSATTLEAIWPAATDNGSVTSYDWRFCDSPGCGTILASGSTAGLAASATGLTLASGTTYFACVRATDDTANTSAYVCSDGVVVDSTAPTTSHGGISGTVAGIVNLTSSSADAGGLDYVEYRIDGLVRATTPAGGATTFNDPGTPFNTATLGDGNHGYRVATYDLAGNSVFSNPATEFIVSNTADATLPTGSISSPAPGALAPLQTLTATVGDNVAIVSVEWLLDGSPIAGLLVDRPLGGSPQASSMTSTKANWNTGGVSAGAHTIEVRVTDAAGNVYVSPSVAVTK